jgi:FkbM family methyltransferase
MITVVLRKIRRVLASFHLFDNQQLLLIKYALSKIGFFVSPEILGKIYGWRYDVSCNYWIKNNIKFRRMYNSIVSIFDKGEYDLNVGGKIVVDVGAYIGDSSIYFAIKGAKKVIAIEPHPVAFKEMLENIQLNSLENVIIPINAGLASKHGKIRIENVDVESTHRIYHKLGNCESEVPAITLGDIISRYKINEDAILKMDCEGCEYDIILNDYEHLKIFKELIFEYHTYTIGKPVSEVLKVLAKDY